MAKKDDRVTVKINSERKQGWEEYAAESDEWADISDLVRGAVTKEINGAIDREAIEDLDLNFDADEIVDAVEVGLSDVHERLERIEDNVADVESAVEHNDDVSQLASDIEEDLIVVDGEEEMRDIELAATQSSIEQAQLVSTPEAWAAHFDVDVEQARRALARAARTFPDVEWYQTEEGTRRYYKVERGTGT